MHQLPPERLVAVHKPQPAEDRQDQVFLHLLDLTERCNGLAGRVIAHNGDAVVGAAYAVVEVPFATQVGTPVGEKLRILPLYLFPYRLPLRFRVVQGDLRPYLLLAGIGICLLYTSFCLGISVVVASASIFSTSSSVVMLSRRFSFFKPFRFFFCPPQSRGLTL